MTADSADRVAQFNALGWHHVRKLPTGEWAGIQQMMFTTALAVGLEDHGYRTRFCYDGIHQFMDAITALGAWDGQGFPPGYWIKQKPQDVTNPARK